MEYTHSIRLSQQARDQLVKLKRRTGIKQWNILCRWALCTSLAETSDPPDAEIPADSTVEMRWDVFAGEYRDVYLAIVIQRCRDAGIATDHESVSRQLRLHLHRGIGYLAADKSNKTIEGLVGHVIADRGRG